MTQLSEEHLEQILIKKLAPLATKEDVRREVREGVEGLARMVNSGFDEMRDQLDVT